MNDLIERYRRQVEAGLNWAAQEKGEAPTSSFELTMRHFQDLGKEIEAALRERSAPPASQVSRVSRLRLAEVELNEALADLERVGYSWHWKVSCEILAQAGDLSACSSRIEFSLAHPTVIGMGGKS